MRPFGPHEFVDAWDPHVPGVREVFHARFVEHAYPLHTHQAWTVLLVDDGAVRYALERHEHGSVATTVTVLPPHIAHDGRAATSRGFVKRVLYLEPDVVGERFIGNAVDRPTITDPGLSGSLRVLHTRLAVPGNGLEAETRVAFVAERIAAHLLGDVDGLEQLRQTAVGRDGSLRTRTRRSADHAGWLRDVLDSDVAAPHSLRTLAATAGLSPTHLVRTFTARFGLPPHAYLLGRRIETARRLLLDGLPPADVAATVGFADQSHLTRHFRRHVGTTPGRFRARP